MFRWGYSTTSFGRYGSVISKLTIYPPDSTPRERDRAYAASLLLPVGVAAGGVAWLSLVVLGVSPGVGLAIVGGVLLPLGVWAGVATSALRRRSVVLWSYTSSLRPDRSQLAAHAHLKRLAGELESAASDARSGVIDAVEFESRWWHAYDDARSHLTTT